MSFWRTYYHLTWATESRKPMITAKREPELYRYITDKADAMGCIIHAIGGMDDHIHLVASIPPKLSIANFVQKIQVTSAYHLNNHPSFICFGFSWQYSYGVFSLGSKQLEEAKAYVLNQKAHHLNGTAIPALERDYELS